MFSEIVTNLVDLYQMILDPGLSGSAVEKDSTMVAALVFSAVLTAPPNNAPSRSQSYRPTPAWKSRP